MMSKLNIRRCLAVCILGLAVAAGGGGAEAYTADASLSGYTQGQRVPLYEYLNTHDYHYLSSLYTNLHGYIKSDDSVFVVIEDGYTDTLHSLRNGRLKQILIMKPGVSTKKGIQVGSSLDEVVKAYGLLYKEGRADIYDHVANAGCQSDLTKVTFKTVHQQKNTFRYYTVSYIDRSGRYLDFIIDKSSKKVRAIGFRYASTATQGTQGSGTALSDWGLWNVVLDSDINANLASSTWRSINR